MFVELQKKPKYSSQTVKFDSSESRNFEKQIFTSGRNISFLSTSVKIKDFYCIGVIHYIALASQTVGMKGQGFTEF